MMLPPHLAPPPPPPPAASPPPCATRAPRRCPLSRSASRPISNGQACRRISLCQCFIASALPTNISAPAHPTLHARLRSGPHAGALATDAHAITCLPANSLAHANAFSRENLPAAPTAAAASARVDPNGYTLHDGTAIKNHKSITSTPQPCCETQAQRLNPLKPCTSTCCTPPQHDTPTHKQTRSAHRAGCGRKRLFCYSRSPPDHKIFWRSTRPFYVILRSGRASVEGHACPAAVGPARPPHPNP